MKGPCPVSVPGSHVAEKVVELASDAHERHTVPTTSLDPKHAEPAVAAATLAATRTERSIELLLLTQSVRERDSSRETLDRANAQNSRNYRTRTLS